MKVKTTPSLKVINKQFQIQSYSVNVTPLWLISTETVPGECAGVIHSNSVSLICIAGTTVLKFQLSNTKIYLPKETTHPNELGKFKPEILTFWPPCTVPLLGRTSLTRGRSFCVGETCEYFV